MFDDLNRSFDRFFGVSPNHYSYKSPSMLDVGRVVDNAIKDVLSKIMDDAAKSDVEIDKKEEVQETKEKQKEKNMNSFSDYESYMAKQIKMPPKPNLQDYKKQINITPEYVEVVNIVLKNGDKHSKPLDNFIGVEENWEFANSLLYMILAKENDSTAFTNLKIPVKFNADEYKMSYLTRCGTQAYVNILKRVNETFSKQEER